MDVKYVVELFRIKMVEPLKMLSREEREQKIKEANYNVFNLKAEDVYIDLLTDSVQTKHESNKWAAASWNESYAGELVITSLLKPVRHSDTKSFSRFIKAVLQKSIFPDFVIQGKYFFANMFFDTTRLMWKLPARATDGVVEEAMIYFKSSLWSHG